MGIPLKPKHLKRYKDIAVLLMRYGRSDLVQQAGLEETLDDDAVTESGTAKAEELASDLEELGPTFIKLGQMLATRVDLLPTAYLEPLSRLHDDVEPFSYEEVEEIVQEELGVRISKAFSEFESEPIAAASLGQVHRAKLRDGRPVAVKVQRPGIRKTVMDDLEAMTELAEFLDNRGDLGERYDFTTMAAEFRQTLLHELDYRREASHLRAFNKNLEKFPNILVPAPIEDYTSSRVLTMEYVPGVRIDALNPVVHLDVGGAELADELFRAYLQQILVDGLFHADPHPGNVFMTPDHKIALIDLGMVGRILPSMQISLLELLLAISEGDGEATSDIALRLGKTMKDHDEAAFRREINLLVSEHQGVALAEIAVGKVVLRVFSAASDNGVQIPPELSVLGKTLLQLDRIGRALAPGFDPNEAIRRNAQEVMQTRFARDTSLRQIFTTLIETKEFVEELPGRVNRFFDAVSSNDFEIRVKTIDEDALMVGFQKVANRITLGLVLAALIVGAALMMRIETAFNLFGYPGIAIICFLAAAAGGFYLVWTILWHDRSAD